MDNLAEYWENDEGKLDTKSEKFRISNTKLHLKYDGHLNFNDYMDWLKNKKKIEVIHYSFVHETGKTGYEHTHILLEFAKLFRSESSKCLDFQSIHPNIKKVVGSDHWKNCVNYHKKDGLPITNIYDEDLISEKRDKVKDLPKPQNFGFKDIKALKDNGSSISDIMEKLVPHHNINKVSCIKAAFNMIPANYGPEPTVNWRPWQAELLREINEKCEDDRSIIWYYDPPGKGGKTVFCRHAAKWNQNTFVSTHCDAYHIATTLQNRELTGAPLNCVMINLPRTMECANNKKLYEGLENIKDGLITSQKFNGETLVFDPPHVIVFSNFRPKINNLSLDRWKIRQINQDFTTTEEQIEGSVPSPTRVAEQNIPGKSIKVAEPDEIIHPFDMLNG